MTLLRVATYNVHKCRGLDRRVSPARVARVLREVDADIVALQEVLSVGGKRPEDDQARFLAEELGYEFCVGENRELKGGAYGNATLSRISLSAFSNYDITWRGRERRGCLRTDVELDNALLHVFNVHLGTAFMERRRQARRLLDQEILKSSDLKGARIVLGDFNEWTRGMATRLLGEELESADVRALLGRAKTYPGVLPLLHLDHIYYDARRLRLERLTLHKSRTALIASDHLPLVADFKLLHS
ncbi:MAG: endonuclease/exonuclease/phosphatase family protein [Pyrinomonadaceae bacterium]